MGKIKGKWSKVFTEEGEGMLDFADEEEISMPKTAEVFFLFEIACNLRVIRLMLAEILEGE